MFKKYYLAYGSNLNLCQMRNRCYKAKPIGTVNLNDYRLVYKGKEDNYAYLTIEAYKGASVPLGLFEVSYFDVFSLDFYEECPTFYSRCYVTIKIGDKITSALIYIMNKNFDYHLPSIDYIETCLAGYQDFGFDQAILDKAYIDTLNNMPKIIKKTFL